MLRLINIAATFVFILLFIPVAYPNGLGRLAYEFPIQVLDEDGQPLPGVNVFTDDFQKAATTTDVEGKAILKDLNYQEMVNFSYIGYSQLRLPFHEIRKANGIIRLRPEVSELAEVVVLGRRDDTPDKVPYTMTKVGKSDIAFTESQTTADALQNVGGLFVQKSQMGGGSPVMRGFETNRVLLVVDGVRMNNAIYRSGHVQNSISVDNAMLEQMEVVFGPGSLIYGSDAMGGVVHFRSKEPKLDFNKTPGSYRMESNVYTRYSSANGEKSIHADVNIGKQKWASLTSYTFTDYGDLRAGAKRPEGFEEFGRRRFFARRVNGSDQVIENVILNNDSTYTDNSNVLIGTAYSQMDFLQKIKYQPSAHFSNVLNFQFSTSSDIPRYDNLSETKSDNPSDLKFAEWYYGPQKRLLASMKTRFSKPTNWYDRATYISSFQRVDEDRLFRKINQSQRTFNLDDVWVYALTGDYDKTLDSSRQHQLMYGFELNYNKVRSTAGKVKLSDESLDSKVITRYPSGDNDINFGALYCNYRWNSADSVLAFNGGLRYTRAHLFSRFAADSIIIWPEYYIDPGVSSNNGDLTWATGLTLTARSGLQVRALGSKAFRSPNLDDFSQIREKNGFVTIPNPSLQPERTYNAELSAAKTFGSIQHGKGVLFSLNATGYYTWLRNAIVRRSFPLPDGSNVLVMEGDSLETQAKVNAETGYIYGWSGQASLQINSNWSLASDLYFTKGFNNFTATEKDGLTVIDTIVPAGHIPPLYGKTSLAYSGKKFKVSFVIRYQAKKTPDQYSVESIAFDADGKLVLRQSGTEDNFEQAYVRTTADGATEPVGALAWTTYNFYSSWQLSKRYTFNFAVENITDLHYRPFSSGVSSAGRNFILSFRMSFSN